jgi:hypothetical protein
VLREDRKEKATVVPNAQTEQERRKRREAGWG